MGKKLEPWDAIWDDIEFSWTLAVFLLVLYIYTLYIIYTLHIYVLYMYTQDLRVIFVDFNFFAFYYY